MTFTKELRYTSMGLTMILLSNTINDVLLHIVSRTYFHENHGHWQNTYYATGQLIKILLVTM